MLARKVKTLTVIGGIFVAMATPAYAKTYDWVDGSGAKRLVKKIGRADEIPTKLNCKEGEGRSNSPKGTLLQFVTKENPDEQKWAWAWGNQFGRIDASYKKKGYVLVSTDSFTNSKSGRLIKCGIWHLPQ